MAGTFRRVGGSVAKLGDALFQPLQCGAEVRPAFRHQRFRPLDEQLRTGRGGILGQAMGIVIARATSYPAGSVHRIAFEIGSFSVHWYGVLVATGFLAGLWTAGRRGLRDGIPPERIADLGVWLIVGSLVGARTLYVVSYWQESFAGKPWTEIFMVRHGGLVFYGGLIGASAATLIYVWRKRLPLWKIADALAPSIALGYVPGRIGCLMNGCCYGQPADWPWAIHFPPEHETQGVGVHPTQIYDSLLNLVLYLGLAWLYRRKKFDGQVFATYLVGYAVTRSFVEMFRGDYALRYLGGWVTPAHWVSLAVLGVGLILFWKLPRATPQKAAGR